VAGTWKAGHVAPGDDRNYEGPLGAGLTEPPVMRQSPRPPPRPHSADLT
jgi:hypothetical protein